MSNQYFVDSELLMKQDSADSYGNSISAGGMLARPPCSELCPQQESLPQAWS